MLFEHKSQPAKLSRRKTGKAGKTVLGCYSKLINSNELGSSFTKKCTSSATHHRLRQKPSAVLSAYLTPKKSLDFRSQKSLQSSNAVKFFQLSEPFQPPRAFQSSGSRSTSSMLCKSRPSFVEPEPVNSPLTSFQPVQSPKDSQQEVYKFPLLRDKQSKSFSLNLNKSHSSSLGSPVSVIPSNPTHANELKFTIQKSFSVHFK